MTALALLSLFLAANSAGPYDTLVVCPDPLRAEMQPWIDHRIAQGHQIGILPSGSSEQIHKAIAREAARGKLRWVVLVGDTHEEGQALGPQQVPTFWSAAKINVKWGSEPKIATDNYYADLDGDTLPELAVGRLSVDSPEELRGLVARILRYERNQEYDHWCRKIHIVAGVGGFGGLVDSVLQMATKNLISEGIPAGFATTMTYASWQSPYCPDPREFGKITIDRLNEGSLFWVYVGHGHRYVLDRMRVPGGAFPIMDVRDAARLACREGAPIAIFLACYTGAFDSPRDCLAEELLCSPGGPIAVFSGSRVTMPYAMAVMSNGLMNQYFDGRHATLGELILTAKRQLASEVPDDAAQQNEAQRKEPTLLAAGAPSRRELLDSIARVLSPVKDQLHEERREHVLLFNLLGDPLLRLPRPQPIELRVAQEARAGAALTVEGLCLSGGECQVELVCRRDRSRYPLATRQRFEPADDLLAGYTAEYQRANEHVWESRTLELKTPTNAMASFQCELRVPEDCRGPCYVRAFVKGAGQYGIAAAPVYVRSAE